MSTLAADLKNLPISERIQLVEDLWDSIAEESPDSLQLSAAERAELHRRYAAHQANPSSSIPWEQVRSGFSEPCGKETSLATKELALPRG
jgi:putative addiction module component (TIGR02574 family)